MSTFEKNFWDVVDRCKRDPEIKKNPIGIPLCEFNSDKYIILYKVIYKEDSMWLIVRADIPKGNDMYRQTVRIPLIELFRRRYIADTIGEYVLGELQEEIFYPAYKKIWGLY